jgi:hypothetical protein
LALVFPMKRELVTGKERGRGESRLQRPERQPVPFLYIGA